MKLPVASCLSLELVLNHFEFKEFNLGSFTKKAADAEWPEAVQKIWEKAAPALAALNERTLATFAQAGIRMRLPEVVAGAVRGGSFQDFNWITFLRLAHREGLPEVVLDLWNASKGVRELFDSPSWAIFASTAAHMADGALLQEMWDAAEDARRGFDQNTWRTFLESAALLDISSLLDEIEAAQEALSNDPEQSQHDNVSGAAGRLQALNDVLTADAPQVPPNQWGHLAKAAVDETLPEQLVQLWMVRERNCALVSSGAWGALAVAAATLGLPEVFESIWRASWRDRAGFTPHTWASFAKGTGLIARADLLQEVWLSTESAREHFNHPCWGAFISGAATLDEPDLLRAIFQSLALHFDPTVLQNWGTLYVPLVRASLNIRDQGVAREMVEVVRGQRVNLGHCIRVLRDVPPHALREKGGQFEGACRCLMRYLILSYIVRGADALAVDLRTLAAEILNLPPHLRDQVWIRMLARGQESYGGALRARYAEAFREACGVAQGPWHLMAEDEKQEVIADIRNPEGLLRRIVDLGNTHSRQVLQHVFAEETPERFRLLSDHLVSNYLGHLRGEKQQEDFWDCLEQHLLTIGVGEFGIDEWTSLVAAVVRAFARGIAEEILPEVGQMVHDVQKMYVEKAHARLMEPDVTPEEVETIAAGVTDVLRTVELTLARVALPLKPAIPLNITQPIRSMLVGTRAFLETSTVQIPQSVRIVAWHGARKEQVEPLFGTVRANVETALRALPPERQIYRCNVVPDGRFVWFHVKNAYDPSRPRHQFSTQIGQASIRRRIQALGGIVREPQEETEDGIPMFLLSFALQRLWISMPEQTPARGGSCAIAVLDDDPEELRHIVASLDRVAREYRLGPLTIEAYGEAEPVVERIRSAGATPPWDIILSDVLMPDAANGGFRVAEAVRERYPDGAVPMKVALVTRRPGIMSGIAQFRRLMVRETAGWLWYFLKEERITGSDEPLLPTRDWERALVQMVLLRDTDRWGFRPLASVQVEQFAARIFCSDASIPLLMHAAMAGGNLAIRSVLLVSEPGSGAELIARLLHHHRMVALGTGRPFLAFNAASPISEPAEPALFGVAAGEEQLPRVGLLQGAEGGTLFVDRADSLPASALDRLLRLLESRQGVEAAAPRPGEPHLVVIGAERTASGSPGAAEARLREMVGVPLRVPALRETPHDIVPAAEELLREIADGDTPTLTPQAREWLQDDARQWPRNFHSLRELVLLASDYGLKREVTERDLIEAEREASASARTEGKVPGTPTPLEYVDVAAIKGRIDFGIITIREDEFRAVHRRFAPQRYTTGNRRYEVGDVTGTDGNSYTFVMVRLPEQGQGPAQKVANDLIQDVAPRWLLLVGIGGATPSKDLSLGDVVCATRVVDFSVHAALEGATHFDVGGGPMHPQVQSLVASLPAIEPHLGGWNSTASIAMQKPRLRVPRLASADYYGDETWRAKVRESLRHHFPTTDGTVRAPLVTSRSVASSDALLKSPSLLQQWLEAARSVAAVEMELAGVYQASRGPAGEYPVLAIRGISDVVGFQRDEAWTKYACETAAAFAFALVRSGAPFQVVRGQRGAD